MYTDLIINFDHKIIIFCGAAHMFKRHSLKNQTITTLFFTVVAFLFCVKILCVMFYRYGEQLYFLCVKL